MPKKLCSCCMPPGWSSEIKAARQDAAKTLELRSLFLRILSSMGVCIPETTKLPVYVLFLRISRAISSSQRIPLPFGPSSFYHFEPWDRSIRLTPAMRSAEGDYELLGIGNADTFKSLRSFIAMIAGGYEDGRESSYCITGSQGSSVMMLKVLGAYSVDPNSVPPIPLIKVKYSCHAYSDNAREGKDVLLFTDAYHLLDILLEENSWRLEQYDEWRSKRDPTYSFLLPLSDLVSREIGSLCNNSLGCIICGRPVRGRCSRCQSVEYCGPDCQRSHWKQHKPSCLPLNDGTWIKIPYFPINRVSGRECSSKRLPPIWDGEPTLYGDEPFLVRIQAVQFSTGENELVVSDRRETFAGRFFRDVDPTNHLLLSLALDDFHNRTKAYLWTKYLGNGTLCMRIDPKPDQTRLIW